MLGGGAAFLLGVIVPYSVASAAQIASGILERGRSVPSFQLLETWNFAQDLPHTNSFGRLGSIWLAVGVSWSFPELGTDGSHP